jgi:AcrR family transcriptional regulator
MSSSPGAVSAKGTRLNRRGLETRQHLLEVALECLASGPEAASANLVARQAGATWGTVQHQFGDVDGLWAAVLAFAREERGLLTVDFPHGDHLDRRIDEVVEMLWRALTRPVTTALYHLRLALPADRAELERAFPATAGEIARLDADWAALCERAFDGLQVDADRLARVRSFLPGALRGIQNEARLSSYLDIDEARRGLAEAIKDYLRAPRRTP